MSLHGCIVVFGIEVVDVDDVVVAVLGNVFGVVVVFVVTVEVVDACVTVVVAVTLGGAGLVDV